MYFIFLKLYLLSETSDSSESDYISIYAQRSKMNRVNRIISLESSEELHSDDFLAGDEKSLKFLKSFEEKLISIREKIAEFVDYSRQLLEVTSTDKKDPLFRDLKAKMKNARRYLRIDPKDIISESLRKGLKNEACQLYELETIKSTEISKELEEAINKLMKNN